MQLGKYSFGTGDRFGQAGVAQLKSIIRARTNGIDITPVWNKSHREHQIVSTRPSDTRIEADSAVKACNWKGSYFVDADHITQESVDEYLESCDFFTIDVAEAISNPAEPDEVNRFVNENRDSLGELTIPGIDAPFIITETTLKSVAQNYLNAVRQAQKVYDKILAHKERDEIAVEISMDEVEDPQSPIHLFFILKMLADHGVRPDTIAPKFSGRFNKGIDYKGDLTRFIKEFEQDMLVILYARETFVIPDTLKLSVHSGSDKFSLYKPINHILSKYDAGLHLKTAGTTWLEELSGLALAGKGGLDLAKFIYVQALVRYEELTAPYKTVLEVDTANLPAANEIKDWDSNKFINSLQHNPKEPEYNPDFRQLLHCSYKIAAEMGDEFIDAVKRYQDIIEPMVEENLYQKHIIPLFSEL